MYVQLTIIFLHLLFGANIQSTNNGYSDFFHMTQRIISAFFKKIQKIYSIGKFIATFNALIRWL